MQKKKRKKKNQKQIKGFTLIELLAVITILGILMLVAIPNITRTIENSRKDTFADTAHAYINAIKTAVAADEIECCTNEECSSTERISACPVSSDQEDAGYYINIDTRTGEDYNAQTLDLMESGGKSSWGNADVVGNIRIFKTTRGSQYIYNYTISLVDESSHGIVSVEEDAIGRDTVQTSVEDYTDLSAFLVPRDKDLYRFGLVECRLVS